MYTFPLSPLLAYMVAYFIRLPLIILAIFSEECKVLVGIPEGSTRKTKAQNRD